MSADKLNLAALARAALEEVWWLNHSHRCIRMATREPVLAKGVVDLLAKVEALEGALREARPLVDYTAPADNIPDGNLEDHEAALRTLLARIDALLSKGGGDGNKTV